MGPDDMLRGHASVPNHPPSRAVAASLAVHAIAIALLWSVRLSEPIHTSAAHISLIAPQVHMRALPVPRFPLHPRPRAFHVPDRIQRVPELTLVVPDSPPSIHPQEIALPAPAPQIVDLPPARSVKVGGFSSVETGETAPMRPTLAGPRVFDPAVASSQTGARAAIKSGTFGDASLAARGSIASRDPTWPNASAAEIIFKPRPAYTDEARRLQIEGEVLLEMLFGASGEARVLRTIRPLGHGLDENAVAAAREIRFRPARRAGVAVDSSALVHIVFQLAY
jgi:TonB family protein